MEKDEIEELQDPATWDDQADEVLPPAQSPRVVVPVTFSPEDFARVARYARAHGLQTTQLIHDATLDHVSKESTVRGRPARA
jgi:hypothetical protein